MQSHSSIGPARTKTGDGRARRVTNCAGVAVAKDRLDALFRSSGEGFATVYGGKGAENLLERLATPDVSLTTLANSGGLEMLPQDNPRIGRTSE